MLKNSIIFLIVFLIYSSNLSAATFSMQNLTISDCAKEITMPINMELNSEEKFPTDITFAISLPRNIMVRDVSAGQTVLKSEKQLHYNIAESSKSLIIIVTGLNDFEIKEGIIAYIHLILGNLSSEKAYPMQFQKLNASDLQASPLPIDLQDGSITLPEYCISQQDSVNSIDQGENYTGESEVKDKDSDGGGEEVKKKKSSFCAFLPSGFHSGVKSTIEIYILLLSLIFWIRSKLKR